MNVPTPHYLLFSEADRRKESGRWRFALCSADGSVEYEAADVEPEVRGERLDLLTVVRALESLDEPAKVTLVGCSPYVRQGLRYGLPEWRDNGWRWEYFGQMVPVKNGDLWQRLDHALRFHRIECRHRRFDPPHVGDEATAGERTEDRPTSKNRVGANRIVRPSPEALRRQSGLSVRWAVPRRAKARWRLWRSRVIGMWKRWGVVVSGEW